MEPSSSLRSFNSFVAQLKPEIGSTGGRYFRGAKGQVHSLNEIVREFRKQAEGLGDDEVLLAKRIISKIEDLDVQANTLLKEKNIIIRITTYIKRFFGNLFYNRGAALKEVKALFPSKRVVTKKVLSLPPEKIDSHMNRNYVFDQMCFGFPEMRSFYENLDQKRSKEKITISPFEATPSDFKVISRMGILTEEELRDFILHTLSVFRDPVRFFEQLEPIEDLITKKLEERGISFGPESEPEYLIKGRGYFIPGPRPQGCTPKQKGKVIDEVLLEIEQQLGINTEGTPVFVGGVTSYVADPFVSMGHVFKEDTQVSTLLLHGKNSHRLGFLGLYYSLQKTKFAYLKPKELLEILIHDKEDRTVGKETIQYSLWNQLIDNNGDVLDQVVRPDDTRSEWFKKLMNSEAYHYSCRSPFMLNSLLLCFSASEKSWDFLS